MVAEGEADETILFPAGEHVLTTYTHSSEPLVLSTDAPVSLRGVFFPRSLVLGLLDIC